MAKYNFTTKDILEQDFNTKMRGYDPEQVDEMLDDVIVDYETYEDEILTLREENEFLRSKISKMQSAPNTVNGDTQRIEPVTPRTTIKVEQPVTPPTPTPVSPAASTVTETKSTTRYQEGTNFDLLKRLSRLEAAVFGPTKEDK